MAFLSWKLLKDILPVLFRALLHLLEDPPPSKSQQAEQHALTRAALISELRSFEPDVLEGER